MSFLSPFFLFAMAAVGIPLVIHLLNLRKPQKLPFSTLSFFKELQKTTIKRIRIKQYILLALRLAAVFCLAMVLARPFLPPNLSSGIQDSNEPAVIGFLLDNSISMGRIDKDGPLFNQALDIIETLADQAGDEDRFLFQLTNGSGFSISLQNINELKRRLDQSEIASSGNYVGDRLVEMQDFIASAPFSNKKLFVLSDGQLSQFTDMVEREGLENRTTSISFVTVGDSDTQNTSVIGLQASSDIASINTPYRINVEVKNNGNRLAANQFLSVEFEGQMVGQYALELNAEEQVIYSFELNPNKSGYLKGKAIIEGDEFSADNTYHFSVFIPESRKVLWVTEDEQGDQFSSYTGLILQAARESDAQFEFTRSGMEVFNSGSLSEYDAIILDGLGSVPEFIYSDLVRYVQSGKGLLFFPSEAGDLNNYNSFLSQFNAGRLAGLRGEYASFRSIASIDQLPEGHPILNAVFDIADEDELRINAPKLYYYLRYQTVSTSNGIGLLRSSLNDILLYEQNFGEGKLFISALGNDPGWSDLPVNPLFAPLYYRTILFASSSEDGGIKSHDLGQPFQKRVQTTDRDIELVLNSEVVRPEVASESGALNIFYEGEEWTPGWAQISNNEVDEYIGINIPVSESDFGSFEENGEVVTFLEETLQANYVNTASMEPEELDNQLFAAGFGKEIWNWFMIAGFILLLIESIVSIWYKA